MDVDDAAARAVASVPGDGAATRATRLAVAHVLYVDDDAERDRWRSNLAACEASLLDGREDVPRPGMTDPGIVRALREAESP
jgi:hypothetical protein